MAFFDQLFGTTRKGEGYEAIPLTETQKQAEQFLMRLLGAVPGFPTREIKGMAPTEQMGQDILAQFAEAGLPESFTAGVSELMKTIGGGYDPRTSPFYKGLRQESLAEEEEAINRLRRGQQLRGTFTSSPGAGIEAKERRRFSGARQQLLGGLFEAERGKQFAAIPQLLQAGQFEEGAPVRKMGAIQQFGALPRVLEQQRADEIFQAIMRKILFPYETQSPIAGQILGQQRFAYDPGMISPSIFSQIGGVAATYAGAKAGAKA